MHKWYENSLQTSVQVLLWSTSVDLKKRIVVLPPQCFYFFFLWPLWLFLRYLSFVLFGIFSFLFLFFPLWDLFLTGKCNTLYKWISTHFYKVLKTQMKLYHDVCNVCLCQCSRKCNDTSATCSKKMYKEKGQLSCGCMIMQKAIWWWRIHQVM